MSSNAQLGYSTDRARRFTYSLAAKRSIVREALSLNTDEYKSRKQLCEVAKSHLVRPQQIVMWSEKFIAGDKKLTPTTLPTDINAVVPPTNVTTTSTPSPIGSPINKCNINQCANPGYDCDNETRATCEETFASTTSTLTFLDEYSQELLDHIDANETERKESGNGTNSQVYIKKDDLSRIDRIVYNRSVTRNCSRLIGGGRPSMFSKEMYHGLKTFFFNQRTVTNSVSLCLLRCEARRINQSEIDAIPNGNPYKPHHALNQRLYRCLRHWDQSYRRGTHRAQNTRHCSKIIEDFQKYVNEKISRLGIPLDWVFNIDETNVPYSLEQIYTWGQKGASTIAIRKPDSTNRLSCLLGCNMSGTLKIMPHLVYTGKVSRGNRVLKELRKQEGYPDNCTYMVQEKAWFDEEVFIDWIENHWRPFLDLNKIEFAYLLIDECKVHMTARVRDCFVDNKTETDYVPAGYTSKLQPLDVGVNGPFKAYIRQDVERYMVEHPEEKVKVHRRNVAHWIADAWEKISRKIIINSWKKAGYDVTERMVIDGNTDHNDIYHLLDDNANHEDIYDEDSEIDEEYDAIVGK